MCTRSHEDAIALFSGLITLRRRLSKFFVLLRSTAISMTDIPIRFIIICCVSPFLARHSSSRSPCRPLPHYYIINKCGGFTSVAVIIDLQGLLMKPDDN